MIFKRTLILNDIQNKHSLKKGVLNLEDINNNLVGTLRLYNFDGENFDNLALGLNSGEDVLKIPIKVKDGVCKFQTNSSVNLQDRLSCALVDTAKSYCPQIIMGGSSTYQDEWVNKVEQAFCQDAKPLDRAQMYSVDSEEIDNEVDKTLQDDSCYQDCSQCVNCKYREAFYSKESKPLDVLSNPQPIKLQDEFVDALAQKQPSTPKIEPQKQDNDAVEPDLHSETVVENSNSQFIDLSKEESQELDKNFYDQVKDQIDKLFEEYERESLLEQLLPNTKWVKVKYEDSESFYVLGLIYEDDTIKYIAYGLPAENSTKPPKDLQEYAQWLPLDSSNPQLEGYWLVYQSADSGESISIEVV